MMGKCVFINLSNHPSSEWGSGQTEDARKYGDIVDIPFPKIPADITDPQLNALVEQYFEKVMQYENPAVMLQGEFVFVFRLVTRLKREGIRVFSGSTERKGTEERLADGSIRKESVFEYCGLREY